LDSIFTSCTPSTLPIFVEIGPWWSAPHITYYTYHHVTLDHRSWLDHVFISADIKQLISKCSIVVCFLNTSDHLPVAFYLNVLINTSASDHNQRKTNIVCEYRWDKGNISGYYNDTRILLSKINHDISIYYNEIIFALTQAANNNILKVPKSAVKHHCQLL